MSEVSQYQIDNIFERMEALEARIAQLEAGPAIESHNPENIDPKELWPKMRFLTKNEKTIPSESKFWGNGRWIDFHGSNRERNEPWTYATYSPLPANP